MGIGQRGSILMGPGMYADLVTGLKTLVGGGGIDENVGTDVEEVGDYILLG